MHSSSPLRFLAVGVVSAILCGAAQAQATSAGTPAVVASRPAEDGHVWKSFESPTLRIRMLVQEAVNVRDRYVFSARGDWIEQHRPSDDRTFAGPKVIWVLSKPADQPIEEAIRQAFIAKLPRVARESCHVASFKPDRFLGVGKQLFELVPSGRYARQIERELKEGPRDFGCGDYGKGQGTRYFEYHPDEDRSRYLFVFAGYDAPLFDEASIQLVSRTASLQAPSGVGRPADHDLLSCRFENGRTIGGIVVMKSQKVIRIWYGDGGGFEWRDVDSSVDPIVTPVVRGRSLVLSGDLQQVVYNDGDEHTTGRCERASIRGAPLFWFNPVLTQPWELQTKP